MSHRAQFGEEDSKRLIVAIIDFLNGQLNTREDLLTEDRECLEITIHCLEMAYRLDPDENARLRFFRPLTDIFSQGTNPVPVRDKLRAKTHMDDGDELMRRNMYRNAEDEYTAAIELDRWNSMHYCSRAGAMIEQQNYFDAIADCRIALMLNPDYAEAYGRMGRAYTLLNRPREAARCYRKALQFDPSNEMYKNNLGVAESKLNQSEVSGIFSHVLSSIFGSGPQTAPILSPGERMPPSFMIFAEIPVRNTPQRSTQPAVNDGETTRAERNGTESSLLRPELPTSFGTKDSNSTASEVDTASNPEHKGETDGNIMNEIPPGYSFFPEVVPAKYPSESGYSFTSKDNERKKINHATTGRKKEETSHPDTHDDIPDGSLESKKSHPKTEQDAKGSKLSESESLNVATNTANTKDGVVDHIDESSDKRISQPKIEEDAENSQISSSESDKIASNNKSKTQGTDSKHTTSEQTRVVSCSSNEERNKLNEEGNNTAASSSDTESSTAEKKAGNSPGILKAAEKEAGEAKK